MKLIQVHRFSLDKSSIKHRCPSCQKKTFVRYKDFETNQYLADHVGRCDREESCRYHYKPKDYFEQNPDAKPEGSDQPIKIKPKPTSYLPDKIVKEYTGNYQMNTLCQWMGSLPGWTSQIAYNAFEKYQVGTALKGPYKGACIFWQIDRLNKVRTGKLMRYQNDGHRDKRYGSTNWVHSLLQLDEYNLQQVLFGLHITKHERKPIAIAESEKTAIIASVYLPNYTWLACGGASALRSAFKRSISTQHVTLYPDLGKTFNEWTALATELNSQGHKVKVSDWLEKYAVDNPGKIKPGGDIADVLIQYDLTEFNPSIRKHTEQPYPSDWDNVQLSEADYQADKDYYDHHYNDSLE